MSARSWIIDGYSLLHRDARLAALLKTNALLAREQLLRMVDRTAATRNLHATIVFDGRTGLSSPEAATSHVTVVFSPSHKTADTVIEQMVHEDSAPSEITVVTSDRLERDTVIAAGAEAMSCAAFLDLAHESDRDVAKATRDGRPQKYRPTLGDHFPR